MQELNQNTPLGQHGIKIKLMKLTFKWYDLWVGIFIDTKKELVCIFPFPMVGLILNFKPMVYWVFKTYGDPMYLNIAEKHTEDGKPGWGWHIKLLGKNYYRKVLWK